MLLALLEPSESPSPSLSSEQLAPLSASASGVFSSAATECASRCLNHCAVWLVHRSGSIAFSLFAVLYIAEGPREPTLLRKRDWLAVAVVLLSLPFQIGQMEVCDLCKMRPAIPPCDVGNTS